MVMSIADGDIAGAVVAPNSQGAIARAATLTSIGNLSSRVIGLLRETVKAYFFSNGQAASAYELASNLPTTVYDALIGGMLSSSLVPSFSALVASDDDDSLCAFGNLLGALIGLTVVVLTVVIALMLIFAQPIAVLLGGPNQDAAQLASLYRLTFPAMLFMNLSGLVTAALQARRKFGFTAFTATVFNLVMIVCIVVFERAIGVTALAIGMLAGSVMQLLIQLPGLRGLPIRLSLNWRLPGVAQVFKLFLPVAGGLVLAQIAALVSFVASSLISENGPATMRMAAQVIQFPLGMIVSAVSIAALPALASSTGEDFKATLAGGLRLMIVLIVPASIALFILAMPVIALLFQHGRFEAASTIETAAALRAAVPNLLFSAIDIPFIYAFYALRDTRTPTLVGLVSTISYLAILAALVWLDRAGLRRFALEDLILANSVKTGIDAAMMAPLLLRKIGGLRNYGIWALTVRVVLAAAVMGVALWGVNAVLIRQLGLTTLTARAITLGAAGAVGISVYAAMTSVFKVDEARAVARLLRRRVRIP